MLVKKLRAAFALATSLLLVSACQAEKEVQDSVYQIDDFCLRAQQLVTGTDLPITNIRYHDYKGFTKSKPVADPLTTGQNLYYQNVPGFEQPMATIISCKLKTSDIIAQLHGEDAVSKAYGEVSCGDIMADTLDRIYAEHEQAAAVFARADIVIEEDDMSRMGPMWLKPWPYQNAFVDESGKLHLRGKALLVPFSKMIPMPDRFKGTHYCHLPTPEYLTAILDGQIKPGAKINY